jgi:hypothetical protein
MIDQTVFAKARPVDVRLKPFPHLVVEEALARDRYDALVRSRPPYPGDASASNRRMAIPAWMLMSLEFYHPLWRNFARLHCEPAIYCRVAELFAAHWPGHLPDLPCGATRFGVLGRDTFGAAKVLTDTRLEVTSPVHGAASSHRRGHVDTPNRLFSALFYIRTPEDDSRGGGLELFRYRQGLPDQLDAFELPPASIELAATIPYHANTLVVFPNSPFAIHGAELRQVTAHDRAYVFITAEVEADLF